MSWTTKSISVSTLLAVIFTVASLNGQSPDFIRTVALSNDVAPGSDPVLDFGEQNIPVINDFGQTAFFTEIDGPAIGGVGGRGEGLFSEATPTGLSQLFREDQVVPGSNGLQTFDGLLNVPLFSNSGQALTSVGGRTGNSIPDRLILRASSGSNQEVLVDIFGSVSGLSGTNITTPTSQSLRLNDSGEVTFTSDETIFTDTGGQGFREVISASPGQPTILQASQTAGISQDILVTSVNSVALNDLSQNLFSANFNTSFGTSESGLFIEDVNSGLTLTASTGVDIEPGIELNSISGASFNNQGQTVFSAEIGGANVVGAANDSALVGNVGGNLEILVREGDAAPGTNSFFSAFGPFLGSGESLPVLGGGGDTAFVSTITGGGASPIEALFRIDELGAIDLVASEGATVAGLASGEVISRFSAPSINANGQVAFQATLTGAGVTFSNDEVIFAEDINGSLQLIAREGELLNVSDDPNAPDFRLISGVNFFGGSGNGDGLSSGFNDLGQVAFRADLPGFTNTGIFVSDLVVGVPEPNTVLVLLFGASVCLGRRRRKL